MKQRLKTGIVIGAGVVLTIFFSDMRKVEPIDEIADTPERKESSLTADVPSEAPVEEQEVEPGKSANRVPGTLTELVGNAVNSDPRTLTLETIDLSFQENVAAALEGSLEAGYLVQHLLRFCEAVPRSDVLLERMIEGLMRHSERMEAEGTPIPPEGKQPTKDSLFVIYPTEAQNRAYQLALRQECQRIGTQFNIDFRERLAVMAEHGHILARYLYATWKPTPALNPESWDIMQEWQLNALRFTYANIEEGEAAGWLAFGQSYTHGLFTPHVFSLSFALRKAALDCGFNNPALQDKISELMNNADIEFQDGSTMVDALLLAKHFAEECRHS